MQLFNAIWTYDRQQKWHFLKMSHECFSYHNAKWRHSFYSRFQETFLQRRNRSMFLDNRDNYQLAKADPLSLVFVTQGEVTSHIEFCLMENLAVRNVCYSGSAKMTRRKLTAIFLIQIIFYMLFKKNVAPKYYTD